MDESKELERRLSDMLTEGDMEESGDADKRERQLIPPSTRCAFRQNGTRLLKKR